MTERIRKLSEMTLRGEMYVQPRKTEFDRMDLFLPQTERDVKRICDYILNQEPLLTEYSRLTGLFRFDGSVVGDAFNRSGHPYTQEVMSRFYLKPVDNLSTMEWQHATADYQKVLQVGIRGIIGEIDASLAVHTGEEETAFLTGLRRIAQTMIAWARKCADCTERFAQTAADPNDAARLSRLAGALRYVPENAPRDFYEAVLTIYVCFSANPDSLGTLDRYLAPFYDAGIRGGSLTREDAVEILQELFLLIQAYTPKGRNFYKGGQSHFCVGGYLPDGTDAFSETTRLIIDSLMDLPTFIPQITFRWTKRTPREVLRYVMDCERKDPNKRIAFTNDEKRLQCYTQVCGIPYERAVGYTMVGCNEPAFLGSITGSTSKINLLRSTETLFHCKAEQIAAAKDFDEYYAVFEKELLSDLAEGYRYDDLYNRCRARDVNYISSLFFRDCIENAKSMTQGGGNTVIVSPMLHGITNVIDGLIVVRQFVYDEKTVTMPELIRAVQANWEGYEELHAQILRRGDFFGNDTERSNAVAQRLYDTLYRFVKDRTNLFGYHFLVGDILGYNEHHKWFGSAMRATPDGRYDGEMIKHCVGQSEGRDRNGLTALLNSMAKLDPNAVGCGATAFNVALDKELVMQDESFEKLVVLFETFFRMGGVQFQLTCVSREELLQAKEKPEEHSSLRVRVTGFSDYFVNLQGSIQDDIIRRTEIGG